MEVHPKLPSLLSKLLSLLSKLPPLLSKLPSLLSKLCHHPKSLLKNFLIRIGCFLTVWRLQPPNPDKVSPIYCSSCFIR